MEKHQSRGSLICLFVFIFGFMLSCVHGAKVEPTSAKFEIVDQSCIGVSGHYLLPIQGQVLLNSKFLSSEIHPPDQSQIQEAILEQLKFLAGNQQKQHGDPGIYHFSVDKTEIKFQTTAVVKKPYGNDLLIDETSNKNPEQSAYLKKAFLSRKTSAQDLAYLVSYDAKVHANICSSSNSKISQIDFVVPLDPYLAYWVVPKTERQLVVWNKAKEIINPCADPEFADIPDPSFYWYFWEPHRELEGKSKSCEDIFKHSSAMASYRVKPGLLNTIRTANYRPLVSPKIDVLRAAFIFGWIDTQTSALKDRDLLKARLENDASSLARERGPSRDASVQDVLNFVSQIQSVSEISGLKTMKTGTHLLVQIDGRYRANDQKFSLEIYWGPTDIFAPQAPEHWNFLNRNTSTSQLLVYAGHSGLGMNFTKGIRSQPNQVKHNPFQTIAILSCYSASYLSPQEIYQIGSGQVSDIILTASNIESMSNISVEIFKRFMIPSHTPPQLKTLANSALTNDYFIVKRIGGTNVF